MPTTFNRLIELNLTSDPTIALSGVTLSGANGGLVGVVDAEMNADPVGTGTTMHPGDTVDLDGNGSFESVYEGRFNFTSGSNYLLGDGTSVNASAVIIEISTAGISKYYLMIHDNHALDLDTSDIQSVTFGTSLSTSPNTIGSRFDDADDYIIVCFAQGTRIKTSKGEIAIEDLSEGDMVITRDHGYQPIRWIKSRTVKGHGDFAPIEFAPGAIGNENTLRLSPNHRVLYQDVHAELLFGTSDVLIAAKHLVNDDTIRVAPCEEVTYYHMLFDQHEIVWSEGAATESYFPGEYSLNGQDYETNEEFFALFPECRDDLMNYGLTAALCLNRQEAQVLLMAA